MNENRRELDGAFSSLDDSLNTGVNRQGGSVNTLLRHLWGNNDLDGGHPLFGDSDGLEVGRYSQTLCHPSAFILSVFERGPRSFNHLRLSMWGVR